MIVLTIKNCINMNTDTKRVVKSFANDNPRTLTKLQKGDKLIHCLKNNEGFIELNKTMSSVTIPLKNYDQLINEIDRLKKENYDLVNSFAIESKEKLLYLGENTVFSFKEKKVICFKKKNDLLQMMNKLIENQKKLEAENKELKKRKWYNFF